MKIVAALCSAVIFSPLVSFADDFKTLDGKEYKDVTIKRAEPDGLVVTTDSGIEKISFSNLSEELRTKYGYNPERAAAFANAVATAQRENNQRAQDILRQQEAATRAAAQSEVKHQVQKVAAQAGTGMILKPAPLTIKEIGEAPFTLRNCAVEVTGIESIDKQEVATGVYSVTLWGGGFRLSAEMTADQCNSVARNKKLFVRVKHQEKYDSEIPVEALGTGVTHEGLSNQPTFFWRQ